MVLAASRDAIRTRGATDGLVSIDAVAHFAGIDPALLAQWCAALEHHEGHFPGECYQASEVLTALIDEGCGGL